MRRSASTRSWPSRSPDSSPAMMAIFSGRERHRLRSCRGRPTTKTPSASARATSSAQLQNQGVPGLDADAGQARRVRHLDGRRSDRRQVGAQFLAGLGAFDQHAARLAGKPAVAPQFLRTRSSRPSVPSMPSTAITLPPIATVPCPMSSAPMRTRGAIGRIEVRPVRLARPLRGSSLPSTASSSGTISCAPTTRMPSLLDACTR